MSAQRCHCWPEDGKVIENAPPPETKEDMRGPLDLVKFKIKGIWYFYFPWQAVQKIIKSTQEHVKDKGALIPQPFWIT